MTRINILIVTILILCAVLSMGCVDDTAKTVEPTEKRTKALGLTDDAIEKELENTLTTSGFDVKKVEVSGGVVWFDIYEVGSWPDYQKKQLIVILAQLAHQERKGSGGTNVYLYDEYGVKIASARYHSIDNTVVKVELY